MSDEPVLLALHVHRALDGSWYVVANVREAKSGSESARLVYSDKDRKPVFNCGTGELQWVRRDVREM